MMSAVPNPLMAGVRDWLFQAFNNVDALRSHLVEFKFKPKPFIHKGLVYHPRPHIKETDVVGKIFIQPYVEDHSAQKLEVELTFILKEGITRADCTDAELLAKVGAIRPAIEIADTRWLNWQFNLGQFLADNSAAQFYVLGDEVDVSMNDLDIHSLIEQANVEVSVTTQPEDQPLRNYLWLVRTLLAQHKSLQTGEVILTGSIIRPMDLKAGHYQFQVLGQQVSLKVT